RAAGYDVHHAALDLAALPPAEPFVDPYPVAEPLPAPADGTERTYPPPPWVRAPPRAPADGPEPPYRPLPVALPRFWTPFGAISDEVQVGIATGGADPLLRHVYARRGHSGDETHRLSGRVFYQYDRFRPTFQVSAESKDEPETDRRLRTREIDRRASAPRRGTAPLSQS